MTTIIFEAAIEAGPGPLANGDLIVLLADGDEWLPDETMEHVDEVAGELSGGGYGRRSFAASVEWLGGRYRAMATSTPQIPHGHNGPLWVVVARDGATDAARRLVRADLVESPSQPVEPSWPDGILSVTQRTGVEALVEGVGVSIDDTDPTEPIVSSTIRGIPDPTWETDDKVLTVDGGDAVWKPAQGGGGGSGGQVDEITAGAGIGVDATDPTAPVVSVTNPVPDPTGLDDKVLGVTSGTPAWVDASGGGGGATPTPHGAPIEMTGTEPDYTADLTALSPNTASVMVTSPEYLTVETLELLMPAAADHEVGWLSVLVMVDTGGRVLVDYGLGVDLEIYKSTVVHFAVVDLGVKMWAPTGVAPLDDHPNPLYNTGDTNDVLATYYDGTPIWQSLPLLLGATVPAVSPGDVLSLDANKEFEWVTPSGGGSGGQVDEVQAGTGVDVDATDPTKPEVSVEHPVPAPASQPDGHVLTVDDGDAVWAAPTGGGSGGGDAVSTWRGLDTDITTHAITSRVETEPGVYVDQSTVMPYYTGDPIPVVDGQGDPVTLGVIHEDHRPSRNEFLSSGWRDPADDSVGGLFVRVDPDTGELTVQDQTGDLTDSDDVMPQLELVRWQRQVESGVARFVFTGEPQSFTVPAGVTSIDVTMAGASGGGASTYFGLGALVSTTLNVTPEESLSIWVGGTTSSRAGGWNGGGAGGTQPNTRGGGGATDIRRGGTALNNRIVVAGGGGGVRSSASDHTGGDGGFVGGDGESNNGPGYAGYGGTQEAGGAKGSGTGNTAGALGLGGDGSGHSSGGGGGYYGGGGGGQYTSGGGGGSSMSTGTNTTYDTNPPHTGIPYEGPPLDGFVTITWEEP